MIKTFSVPRQHAPTKNRLLAALSRVDYERMRRHFYPVSLPLGRVVYEPHSVMGYVIFPTEGIVSLLYLTQNGSSTEIAVVGNEGMVGISVFMGGSSTPSRAVVQSEGQGYRLNADVLNSSGVGTCSTCCCASPRR